MTLFYGVPGTLALFALSAFFAAGGFDSWRELGKKFLQTAWQRIFALLLLASAGITAYALWLFGPGRDCLNFLLLAGYLLAITPTDLRERLIPDAATACFAAAFVLSRLLPFSLSGAADAALGAAVGLAALGIPWLLRRDCVGAGDIKAVAACGILLGPLGLLAFLLRAFAAIFLFSLARLLLKKANLKTQTPFAPFLLLAALL